MIAMPKTDKRLLKRLRESAKKLPTKEQLHRQRVSFVFGNLPNNSTLTRDQVAKKIKMNEGA